MAGTKYINGLNDRKGKMCHFTSDLTEKVNIDGQKDCLYTKLVIRTRVDQMYQSQGPFM